MLSREIIAVCSETHTEHINALCGQSLEFILNLPVREVTTVFLAMTVVIRFVLFLFNILLTLHRDLSVQQEPTGCTTYFQLI